MTVPPDMQEGESRRAQRRFVWASIVIVILIAILLVSALQKTIEGHRALCPPGNPNCGMTPPGPAPTTQPMALPAVPRQ